jgi:hypothetical protein
MNLIIKDIPKKFIFSVLKVYPPVLSGQGEL